MSPAVSFVVSYLSLADQLLLLYTPGTRHLINESLVSVLHAQLRHLDLAVRADKVSSRLYLAQCFGSTFVVCGNADSDPTSKQGLAREKENEDACALTMSL